MRRTTIAIALATGALAVPGYALASGGGDPAPSSTTPVQQQNHDCPEGQQGGSGNTQL